MVATNEQTAIDLFHDIDKCTLIDIKDFWFLSQYNGIDISQIKCYVKLSNETYINKLLEEHDWQLNVDDISNIPILVGNESTFNQHLETAIPPNDDKFQPIFQVEIGLNYPQTIDEVIFFKRSRFV